MISNDISDIIYVDICILYVCSMPYMYPITMKITLERLAQSTKTNSVHKFAA